MTYSKILIIQTAFIGDVVLATPVLVKLKKAFPSTQIDFLVRKGCEPIFQYETRINELIVWEKKSYKWYHLMKLLRKIRGKKYDWVINLQRHGSTGFLSALSGAKQIAGFKQNPFSFAFTKTTVFKTGAGIHEIDRNLSLIDTITDNQSVKPELIVGEDAMRAVKKYKSRPYVVIAPNSVLFSKTYPIRRWIEFLNTLKFDGNVYLIGSAEDGRVCDKIIEGSTGTHTFNTCGLSIPESVALIKDAVMNYVNDSAPMHFASAVNAPVTAVYCSTVPEFGFGPLSDVSFVAQTGQALSCRPCGLHGFNHCKEGHFKCSRIELNPNVPTPEK